MRGGKCPGCSRLSFFDQGSYDQCSKCSYIGWSRTKGVANVGKGRGNACPNCEKHTLHKVLTLTGGESIRRCAVCDYSAIEPAADVAMAAAT